MSVNMTQAFSRRRFMQGLGMSGALIGLSPALSHAEAKGVAPSAPELKGKEFSLTVAEMPVNITGSNRKATAINGSIPAPTLRWREGDTVTIHVSNKLSVPTSIHWHGMILPYQMDGVPGLSFAGIAPGETYSYTFKVQQSGTYWYHSHSGFQEQTGMYGAIIIEPRNGERHKVNRDYIVQLSDWTDENPMSILARLKKQEDYFNFNQPTVMDFFRDVSLYGFGKALERREMFNQMRMSPTDISDVSGYTYTYLINGATPSGNWTGLFKKGEKIRLRFVSSGTQSYFDVRIPGLEMKVIQVDGIDIEPVTVDEFRCGPGETYDVIVTPKDEVYTIFAQSMDRSGYARGTLAVKQGLQAPVPSVDKPEWLTMSDMMGNMSHGDHGGHTMGHSSSVKVRHAKTEYGPSVDMRVDSPRTNLDDPGIGLRNNGRRVLTYADLKTLGGVPDRHKRPGREIELHLTGNMERYTWSIDGLEYGKSSPIYFKHNERLRVILHNDTMMTHPMHLHGMWSDIESPDGNVLARKHTISVQPAQRVSFQVTADALGRWAWHCHLLYHMDAGMFREVVVA
ncbi:MAG: copper resistance system multicopper oxidase [Gammaproteobacteria bacterium]|nr:copper resistance system multicopper oxidase [Gammaproteobacteria bacterium]MDH5694383.1 copper resistance system multicopper oxidase [Gammaproteobacteria bacterium]